MKAKLITFLFILATLACFLALSVGATDIPSFTEVENITVDTSSLAGAVQNDNSSRVLLRDSNGNYATYLTKYITQFKGGSSDHSQFVAYFDALNSATGKDYDVTSIIAIEIPEGTQRISNTYSQTSTWTNVMYVKAPSTLVYQQRGSYNSCKNLKILDYSKASITDLEQELITNNSGVEIVRFPQGVVKVGKWAIHGLSSLQCAYVPSTVEAAESMINNTTGSGKFVFFYTGKMAELHTPLYDILGNTNVIELEWDSKNSDSYYIDLAKSEGKIYIVYGYSHCEAFNDGIHANEQINSCVNVCTICNLTSVKHIDTKAEKATVSYKNGFLSTGIKHTVCSNEDCNYDVTEEAQAIFETNGYSIPEDGRGQIAICFAVNKEALNDYESIMSEKLTYGAFAIAYNNIGDGEILDNDKAIKTEINRDFKSFEMKITGIKTEEQMNAKISFGAYTVDKNGKISYLQPSSLSEGGYSYVTYSYLASIK